MESLQPGDACVECLNRGLSHTLRYFYLNLEEQLLKCESRTCLWPHNDAVSSDEEDLVAEATQTAVTDVVEDDDEFIKQLLEQLGSGNDSTTNSTETHLNPASSSNEATSAPSNIDDILSLSDLWTSTQQLHSDESLTEVHSPKSLSALTQPNYQQCDKQSPIADTAPTIIYTLPDLLSESSVLPVTKKPPKDHSETQAVKVEETQSTDAIEPTINYTISYPQQVQEQPITKSPKTNDTPKVKLFQAAPKKASTIARKQQQQPAEAEPTSLPSVVPTVSIQTSSFLDALKRPVAPPRPARGGRRQTRSRRENVGSVRFLSGGMQALKQKLERLEAHSRQRDLKAESEPET